MKRNIFPAAVVAAFIATSIVHAQDTTQTPVGQRQGGARGPGGGQRQGAPVQPEGQQREARQEGFEEVLNASRGVRFQALPMTTATITTAWWSNANLVTKLGLTDIQKSKILSAFEAHRQNLAARKDQLEKEEAQLSRFLDAESIDRGGVFTQINRVIQARGEVERVNATMTLEMREQLTRAQWTQLQAAQPSIRILTTPGGELPFIVNPGKVTPGARGARSGNPAQQ